MSYRRQFTLGIVLLLTFLVDVRADSWPQPKPRIFAQTQGEYAFKILPVGTEGVFLTLDESGKEKVIWQAKLVNLPVRAIVAESGKFVITLDTWASVGYEHCLVVYGEKGKVVADFKLEDLLTAKEIENLPSTAGSRWWTDKDIAEFEDLSRQDEFVIRMKHKGWTKVLRLTLSTGKLAKE
jgi:hypothetical protein